MHNCLDFLASVDWISINAQDSLDNLIWQNVITWGVLMDGKDMTYNNQNSAYVPAVRQLFCAMRDTDLQQSELRRLHVPDSCTCTLKVFCVCPKREFIHFYLALFNELDTDIMKWRDLQNDLHALLIEIDLELSVESNWP